MKKSEKIVKELSDEELMEVTGGYQNWNFGRQPYAVLAYGVGLYDWKK